MKRLRITIEGKVYDVEVDFLDEPAVPTTPSSRLAGGVSMAPPASAVPAPSASAPKVAEDGVVPSPLSGTVVSVDVAVGATVSEGQQLLTLEAMKMNTFVNAPAAGMVEEILTAAGDTVEEGQGLIRIS
ncbi:MAG: biotin/lipoyl-containing protein [Opitutales bacterium]